MNNTVSVANMMLGWLIVTSFRHTVKRTFPHSAAFRACVISAHMHANDSAGYRLSHSNSKQQPAPILTKPFTPIIDVMQRDVTAFFVPLLHHNFCLQSTDVGVDASEPPLPSWGRIFGLSTDEHPVLLLAFFLQLASEACHLTQPLVLAAAYDAVVRDYNNATDTTRNDVRDVFIKVFALHTAGGPRALPICDDCH